MTLKKNVYPESSFRNNKFSPVFLLGGIATGIFFLTRLLFLVQNWNLLGSKLANVPQSLLLGLLYDIVVSGYIVIPMILHLWLTDEKLYKGNSKWIASGFFIVALLILNFTSLIPEDFNEDLHKGVIWYMAIRLIIFVVLALAGSAFRQTWRIWVLYFDFFLFTFLLLFNAVSEWFFWQEFSVRYNFIAVDYLVYTNEVIGNIRESYPVFKLMMVIAVVAAAIVWLFRALLKRSVRSNMPFTGKTKIAILLLLVPVAGFLFVNPEWKKFSKNEYANEVAGNGLFDFGHAFWHNQLDFYKFYQTLPDREAFAQMRKTLADSNSRFLSDDVFDLDREISYPQPETRRNVVLISVESFDATFMKYFGNTQNLTPRLDSLASQSLVFSKLYASGTRTVRGLEALTLSIPPTPGQSTVKRPDNENLFSLGSVFDSKGYISQYIYGGYGYFDNMNYFFSNNGYQVIDRSAIDPKQVHYQNIWGVADEDLFTLALHTLDSNYKSGKPFFSHIMTVSNHRPFTYPDGRIDIPSSSQSREGAVKYTDYSIGKFISEAAAQPWFNNTIFVIVADHCAGSAGSVQLPVTGYHIPMLIYAPGIMEPGDHAALTSQIDIAPTILGLLKFNYLSKFFGRDVLAPGVTEERAFISTYQGLGFLKDQQLVIQSPVRKVKAYLPNYKTGEATETTLSDSLSREAISYYQCASWLLKNKRFQFKALPVKGSGVPIR
ncbi:MAG: sulfatase-like hydrolase/transferase [Chitinophagaceae bacterium]